ncbi:MAG: hypothetical protein K5657_08805 [Desulfovibrio sp.]|nr:hypothetical protein [Desulfovibrio sp.]
MCRREAGYFSGAGADRSGRIDPSRRKGITACPAASAGWCIGCILRFNAKGVR